MSIFQKIFRQNKKESITTPEDKISDLVVALDIGTEYIKCMIFEICPDGKNVLSYAKKKQMSKAMNAAVIIDLEKVLIKVKECYNIAISKLDSDKRPKDIIIGIAGEAIMGEVINVNYTREDPHTLIDQEEMNFILSQLKENSFDKAINALAEKNGYDPADIVEVYTRINDCHIGNYRVNDLRGFKGDDISFKLYTTYGPKVHLESLKTLARFLGLTLRKIMVIPFVIANNFKLNDENFSGIFIDIGGGTTDIAVVKNGAIYGTQMFGFGGKMITERISNVLGIDEELAEIKKIAYSKNQIGDNEFEVSQLEKSRIKKVLERDCNIWCTMLEVALNEIEDINIMPHNIYLSGGGALLPEIRQVINNYPWQNSIAFERVPVVSTILPKDINNIIDIKKLLTRIDDISITAMISEYTTNN